jgi:hypothetical protein
MLRPSGESGVLVKLLKERHLVEFLSDLTVDSSNPD